MIRIRSDRGASALEYALLLAFVAGVLVVPLLALHDAIVAIFVQAQQQIPDPAQTYGTMLHP